MKKEINNDLMELFVGIFLLTEKKAILTGSLALILQNELEERICSDLDIILPFYIDLSSFGKVVKFTNPYLKPGFEIHTLTGKTIHGTIDPACYYNEISFANKNNVNFLIKVSWTDDIWIEKFKSFIRFNTEKNKKDIIQYLQKEQNNIVNP